MNHLDDTKTPCNVGESHQGGRDQDSKACVVLNAASTIFFRNGFAGATTDMIQREAGVSKSTVYAHYSNKETLFLAAIEAACNDLTDKFRAIRFQPGKLRETLKEFARAYLDILLSERGLALTRIVVAEGERFPDLAARFYVSGPMVVSNVFAGQLESAVSSGELILNGIEIAEAAILFTNLVRSEPQLLGLLDMGNSATRENTISLDRWIEIVSDNFIQAYVKFSL